MRSCSRSIKIENVMCSNSENNYRTYLIMLRAAMDSMVSDSPEYWKVFNENPQYLISNHGRVQNLNSYGRRPRILIPTLRMQRYLFVSVTIGTKRKTLSLNKLHHTYFKFISKS